MTLNPKLTTGDVITSQEDGRVTIFTTTPVMLKPCDLAWLTLRLSNRHKDCPVTMAERALLPTSFQLSRA